MKDELGKRMKGFYEDRVRYHLPRRNYALLRIDGKAFHTYTKGLQRPFDEKLVNDMNSTAEFLCKEIQGAEFAYVQSDEISILVTDFKTIDTDAWFDYNIQKMVSVSASLATAKFNELRPGKLAFFDSRVFSIPSRTEVANYFIWRQKDCVRNSVQSYAQSIYSHKQLMGLNTKEIITKLESDGHRWNELPEGLKNGRLIRKVKVQNGEQLRTKWKSLSSFIFTEGWNTLLDLIPSQDE